MPNVLRNIPPLSLVESLRYDSGVLIWTRRVSMAVRPNMIAGTPSKDGHIRIRFKGTPYFAHHIVWYMHHGEWPKQQIDHINRIPDDNRIENLRLVNYYQQQANRAVSTKVPGVCWHDHNMKWHVRIGVNGKRIFLGFHKEWWDAVCARKSAENKYV